MCLGTKSIFASPAPSPSRAPRWVSISGGSPSRTLALREAAELGASGCTWDGSGVGVFTEAASRPVPGDQASSGM